MPTVMVASLQECLRPSFSVRASACITAFETLFITTRQEHTTQLENKIWRFSGGSQSQDMYRFLEKLQEQTILSQALSLATPSPQSMSDGSLINARRRWQSLPQAKRALFACLASHQKWGSREDGGEGGNCVAIS